ncbi:cell division protein FtsA [Candidatus Falkowbacteria bacterium]|nr:cell division protein FtsA [Candidatus Falkowbacteria bacterium]
MPNETVIAGLDIGSANIRMVVGQRSAEQKLNIIAAAEVPAEGINKGTVVSIEEAVNSINKCLEKTEKIAGTKIETAWVGISGSHIISQESKGVVAISRSDGEITEDDVERAIEAARTVATPSNYEILHVIPRTFTIDGQTNIKDPVGMNGIRLEVDTQIIQGLTSQIKNLTKCVYRTGLDIEDLVLSILASSEAVLTNRQKDLGVILVNIGASTTSLIVFEEGDVLHTAVLPIGADHITADLAIGLRVSIDTAERVKLNYGTAVAKDILKKDEINLFDLDATVAEDDAIVSRKYIAEIIEARTEEIFEKIDSELKKADRSGSLPAGVVLIGSGVKLPGIVEVAKRKLRLPACLGFAQNLTSAIDKVQDLGFLTAVGLVVWGDQLTKDKKRTFSISQFKSVAQVGQTIRGWFDKIRP